MTMRPWLVAKKARTLREAHEAVARLRPALDASSGQWVNFHVRSSAVYRRVAEVDHGHEGEALYWCNREQAKADELAARPAGSGAASTGSTGRRRRVRRGKASEAETVPATLEQAHDVLREVEPGKGAPVEAWAAYHRHAMSVYAEVSEVDRAHHHEALVFAGRARMKAAGLLRQVEDGAAARVKPVGGQPEQS